MLGMETGFGDAGGSRPSARTGRGTATALGLVFGCGLALQIASAAPAPVDGVSSRTSSTEKGSLLVFPDIEIKWDAAGRLIQDTVVTLHNDYPADVDVKVYFVNGDEPLEEVFIGFPIMRLDEAEPGWNTADCRFQLTSKQPTYWSAANGRNGVCQSFGVLDPPALFDLPGRPDPETNGETRVLRGFMIAFAIGLRDVAMSPYPDPIAADNWPPVQIWQEINWNHLSGSAMVVNYQDSAVFEYGAYAFSANKSNRGEPTDEYPGRLLLDGFEYEHVFDQLLLDFYAPGSTTLSRRAGAGPGIVPVSLDTDLTLLPMWIDVRQDNEGPFTVKAEVEIFNQNESKFSGTRKCITCWNQTLLSEYVDEDSIPNHFVLTTLGTDKGQARITSVFSDECRGAFPNVAGVPEQPPIMLLSPGPFLGVTNKILSFNAGERIEHAGTTLPGSGTRNGVIVYDVVIPPGGGE